MKHRIKRNGYWAIYKPEHPNAQKQGYVFEHRYVMSKFLKRPLKKGECVHHKDGNQTNNDINNLELCESHGKHIFKYHPETMEKLFKSGVGRPPANKYLKPRHCMFCNKKFQPRNYKTKFCSHKCYGESKVGAKITKKQKEALEKGHGWNKGKPMTWAPKGKNSPHYKHGKFSKFI